MKQPDQIRQQIRQQRTRHVRKFLPLALFCVPVFCLAQSAQDAPAAPADVPTMGSDIRSGYSSSVLVTPPVLPPDAIVLDRVVAVLNGDVILESDVLEEERFAKLQPFQARGRGTDDQRALNRVINRTLILQQLKELPNAPEVKDAEFASQLEDLRKHLPACAADKCVSDAGWKAVLASQGFTEAQFDQRWRVRMLVLGFIEQRFRAGVRVSKPEIQSYYDNEFVPVFKKRNLPAPPLAKVSPRIDEILLQQHVNVLLSEWLNSLKDQGSVAILDSRYSQDNVNRAAADNPDAEGDAE